MFGERSGPCIHRLTLDFYLGHEKLRNDGCNRQARARASGQTDSQHVGRYALLQRRELLLREEIRHRNAECGVREYGGRDVRGVAFRYVLQGELRFRGCASRFDKVFRIPVMRGRRTPRETRALEQAPEHPKSGSGRPDDKTDASIDTQQRPGATPTATSAYA